MKRTHVLAFAACALLVTRCLAQVDVAKSVAKSHIESGLALAAAGDTAAALSELRTATEVAPDLAEAHFQLGRLLAGCAESRDADRLLRDEAEMSLLRAAALDPTNKVYLEELARLSGSSRMTAESRRAIDALLKSAGGSSDNAQLADTEFLLGFIEERDYERFRDRRLLGPRGMPISTGLFDPSASIPGTPWLGRYVEWYLENAPAIPGSGASIRRRMEEHYRAALRYNPTHYDAGRRLMLILVEENRLDEYLFIARRLVDAHPQRAGPQLYLGLGLHATGREDEAGVAFDAALAKMPTQGRLAWENLEQFMRREPAKAYSQLDGEQRDSYQAHYWRLTDPLYLTEANERRLEHLSRVAYVDLRFSEPATGRRGWETERGIIFIRYGPPDVAAVARGAGTYDARNTIVWAYAPGPVFMFSQRPGYFHARFAGNYEWVANEARYVQPAAYTNIPSIPMLEPMPVQIARFRGASPEEISVEIHSELPLEVMSAGLDMERGEIETGLFLLNQQGDRIVQQVETEVLEYADASTRNALRSWRLLLPAPGKLVAAVEARDGATWRAATARDTFTAHFFSDDSLALSDMLLAESLRPLAAKPLRRADYDIAANASRRYAKDQPVVIYYELYGLQPDGEGFASYEVSLAVTLKSLNREGTVLGGDRNPLAIIGVLADAWGFSPVGDDRLELRFTRELDMKGRDRATEYHSLDLQQAPAGEYEITLKVWDALGEELATRTRVFAVVRGD